MQLELSGGCHCGAITVRLRLASDVGEVDIRACQCSFCRRHGAKSVADPGGVLSIAAAPGALARYRFGLRTADYLLCSTCGCYVAAVAGEGAARRAVLNVVGAGLEAMAASDARPVRYDDEDAAQRGKRRLANWMPVEIVERDDAVAV